MDGFEQAVEIIPGRYYLAVINPATSSFARSAGGGDCLTYCIDHELLYEPFYADFGPLNLGRTYRFCEKTARLLQEADKGSKRLYLCCGPQGQQKANAAVLVGAFQVLLMGRAADAAYAPLAALEPFIPFRDASCGVPCFNLQVQHCLRGLERAVAAGFLDASGGAWRFDAEEYEHYEQVENGDLTWIVPGKLAAFSGPAASPNAYVGFRAMVPEDYVDYYHGRGVTAVVRLNKKVYDRCRFTDGGLRHHEMYFPDGSCPSTELLLQFLREPGALAIHCKAGLGRTGVLICSYIMKHYGFTAEEVIGYIRICRPGSVIGPQQTYLKQIQPLMWREGESYRAARGPAPPRPVWGPAAPGRAAWMRAAALPGGAAAAAPQLQKLRPAGARSVSLVIDATGDSRASSAGGGGGGSSGSGTPVAAAGRPPLPPQQSPLGGGVFGACGAGSVGALQGLFSALGGVGGIGGVSSHLPRPSSQQLAAAGAPQPPQHERAAAAAGGASMAARPASQGAVGAGAAGALAGARPQTSSSVVRVLAPNGQPRKVPASMLQAAADISGGAGAGSAPATHALGAPGARRGAR